MRATVAIACSSSLACYSAVETVPEMRATVAIAFSSSPACSIALETVPEMRTTVSYYMLNFSYMLCNRWNCS
jgi:hypothetical protein